MNIEKNNQKFRHEPLPDLSKKRMIYVKNESELESAVKGCLEEAEKRIGPSPDNHDNLAFYKLVLKRAIKGNYYNEVFGVSNKGDGSDARYWLAKINELIAKARSENEKGGFRKVNIDKPNERADKALTDEEKQFLIAQSKKYGIIDPENEDKLES